MWKNDICVALICIFLILSKAEVLFVYLRNTCLSFPMFCLFMVFVRLLVWFLLLLLSYSYVLRIFVNICNVCNICKYSQFKKISHLSVICYKIANILSILFWLWLALFCCQQSRVFLILYSWIHKLSFLNNFVRWRVDLLLAVLGLCRWAGFPRVVATGLLIVVTIITIITMISIVMSFLSWSAGCGALGHQQCGPELSNRGSWFLAQTQQWRAQAELLRGVWHLLLCTDSQFRWLSTCQSYHRVYFSVCGKL